MQPTKTDTPTNFMEQCDKLFEKTGDTTYLQMANNHREKLKQLEHTNKK